MEPKKVPRLQSLLIDRLFLDLATTKYVLSGSLGVLTTQVAQGRMDMIQNYRKKVMDNLQESVSVRSKVATDLYREGRYQENRADYIQDLAEINRVFVTPFIEIHKKVMMLPEDVYLCVQAYMTSSGWTTQKDLHNICGDCSELRKMEEKWRFEGEINEVVCP